MNQNTIFTIVNSICIMVLYLLVFALFYDVNSLKYKYFNLEIYKKQNDQQFKNLVDDVNHNDRFLKKYLDIINNEI